jgi:multiple antibiotic resistance protein
LALAVWSTLARCDRRIIPTVAFADGCRARLSRSGWLDVSPENFQLAAGLIMLPQALQLLVRGRTLADEGSAGLLPLAVSLLAGPASVVAAMSYGARFGEGTAAGASALVLFATAGLLMAGERFQRWVGRAGMGAFGRFNGALLVVVAVELIVDGVRSV